MASEILTQLNIDEADSWANEDITPPPSETPKSNSAAAELKTRANLGQVKTILKSAANIAKAEAQKVQERPTEDVKPKKRDPYLDPEPEEPPQPSPKVKPREAPKRTESEEGRRRNGERDKRNGKGHERRQDHSRTPELTLQEGVEVAENSSGRSDNQPNPRHSGSYMHDKRTNNRGNGRKRNGSKGRQEPEDDQPEDRSSHSVQLEPYLKNRFRTSLTTQLLKSQTRPSASTTSVTNSQESPITPQTQQSEDPDSTVVNPALDIDDEGFTDAKLQRIREQNRQIQERFAQVEQEKRLLAEAEKKLKEEERVHMEKLRMQREERRANQQRKERARGARAWDKDKDVPQPDDEEARKYTNNRKGLVSDQGTANYQASTQSGSSSHPKKASDAGNRLSPGDGKPQIDHERRSPRSNRGRGFKSRGNGHRNNSRPRSTSRGTQKAVSAEASGEWGPGIHILSEHSDVPESSASKGQTVVEKTTE